MLIKFIHACHHLNNSQDGVVALSKEQGSTTTSQLQAEMKALTKCLYCRCALRCYSLHSLYFDIGVDIGTWWI